MILKKKYIVNIIPTLLVITLLSACGEDKPEVLLSSAKASLAKNDPKTAIIQIKNALESNPNLPEGRFLLGSSLLASGDPINAEIEFEKARSLKFSDDLVIPALAKALLVEGKFKKVIDDFAQVKLSTPSAIAGLQISLSNAYAAQGLAELSKKSLDLALATEPENSDALMIRVRQFAQANDKSSALSLIDKVIANSPKNPEPLRLKGDILYLIGNDLKGAVEFYKKSLEVLPSYMPSNISLLSLLLKQDDLDSATQQLALFKKFAEKSFQYKYFETQLTYQKKDFKSARDLSQQLLKMAPQNDRVLQLAGAVEYQLNSFLQAETYLSKAVSLSPELLLARRLLTVTYLRTGQAAKALATLLPVLSKEPVDPTLYSIAGEVYLQNGDVKNASDYFEKSAKLDPKNGKKRTALALTHMMSGNAESAFNELNEIANSDTGVAADMALISVHLRRQELDKALKAVDGLERKQPENPLAWNLRGRIQLAQNNKTAARKSFEAALKLNPTYFSTVSSLAALDIADKKLDDARGRFESVLKKDPKNSAALLALAEMRSNAGGSESEVSEFIGKAIAANPLDAAPHIILVKFYIKNKNYKLALASAQNAVSVLPENAEVLDALGRAQEVSGDANQALSTYNKLAAMQPSSPQPFMRMAEINFAAKNNDSAIQNINKALLLKPDFVAGQQALILINKKLGKDQESISIVRSMQKQRPKEAIGYMLEGDIYADQKKWTEALAAYNLAYKQSGILDAGVKIHSVLIAAGKKEEEVKFSANWLKDHPKDIGFIFHLADQGLASNDFISAEKFYNSIIKIQPENALAYNNLAWVSGRLKKESAIAFAEKANDLARNEPAFMDTLAVLLSEKGDFPKAIELQKKVVSLQSGNPVFKLNLAKIYIKSNDKNKAKVLLDDLVKLGDKYPGQKEVSELMKSI